MIHRINFDDKVLRKALCNYFNVKVEQVKFIYVASILNNGNVFEYDDKLEEK